MQQVVNAATLFFGVFDGFEIIKDYKRRPRGDDRLNRLCFRFGR